MKLLVLVLIYFLVALHQCFCARNELIATADCVCPGRNFTYECSVVGGLFTVWRGTVISMGCEVTLFHSDFEVPGAARRVCNNGAVVGYNVGVENNCYTSNLDVLVSSGLNGRTVECIMDDGITNTLINTTTLSITTTPFPPPTNVRLIMAGPGELTFSWLPPQQRCPYLTFNVISNDCGTCQNNSAFSNTTCRKFTLPSTCTLTVQSIVCGNLVSIESNRVIARLNVPEVPTILEVYPYYSESDRRLLRLTVIFNTTQPFQISDGIDGSTDFYTVIYSDSTSGSICGSATIPASSCTDEMCAHLFSFDTSSSLCPPAADIGITIFATNTLGNGPTSEPTFQDGINSFVEINFNSEMKTIICTFLNQPMDTTKECFLNITYGPNCGQQLGLYISEGTGDSVSSPELPLLEGVSEYCFTITARSNNVTVSVEGTLNLFEVSNVNGEFETVANTAVVTAAIVVPVVIISLLVVGAVLVMTALLLSYLFRQSLIVIKFSNPDKSGSLAQMLKIFKDNGINIISINTYNWTEADIKWKLCGRRRAMKEDNIVHISCTNDEKRELEAQSHIKLEFIEDDGTESVTTGSTMRARTVKVKPEALWEVLNEFGTRGINIHGLNTRSSHDSTPGYEDNYVSCICSSGKEKKIVRALEVAGALSIEVEHNIKPSTRILQFYVKDKPGALANALKAFRKLNINTTGFNPAYMNSKLASHGIPGHETFYFECECGEDERKILFEELRKSASDAIQIQLHDDQEVISRKRRELEKYCIVKCSIQDKVGSLISALEVFQTLQINILGVNSFGADPSIELRPEINVKYKDVQMVVSSESDIEVMDLRSGLQSSGHIIDVQCDKSSKPPIQGQVNYDVKFLVRDQVGSLIKGLSAFIDHGINIVSLSQKSVSLDVRYVHNHVKFVATNQQEVELISELHATGLVMNVEVLPWDDHYIAKMKGSHTHRGTTQGEMDGNAFEHEPPSAITTEV